MFYSREKEKYKRWKQRQTDLHAYQKLKQLLVDLKGVRVLFELVKRREEVRRQVLDLQCDWFDARHNDMVDTSGLSRVSDRLTSWDELCCVRVNVTTMYSSLLLLVLLLLVAVTVVVSVASDSATDGED